MGTKPSHWKGSSQFNILIQVCRKRQVLKEGKEKYLFSSIKYPNAPEVCLADVLSVLSPHCSVLMGLIHLVTTRAKQN